MKILHSADWHLDAPMTGHSPEAADKLRRELRKIPERIATLCLAQGCDLLLLAGDLFDGKPAADSVAAVKSALERVRIPVFIAPGNHDFCGPDSVYLTESWPANVRIFTRPVMESVSLPELNCRIWGAGYNSMDCPGLLRDFRAQGEEAWQIGLLHGEADNPGSPYCPVSKLQIRESGLHYLALGHIHKGSGFQAGDTVCAWPGCPIGRGFDELGPKGVVLVSLEEKVLPQVHLLDTPRFFDEEVEVSGDAVSSAAAVLPSLPTEDFYRITLTGYCSQVDTQAVAAAFPHVPHLTLRDETLPESSLWSALGADSLEGVYFGFLHGGCDSDSATVRRRAKLAAQLSRKILDGQEVKLP